MYEYVGGFEIAMYDCKFAHFLEALDDLLDNVESSVLVDFASRGVSLEIASWTVLHNQVDVVGGGYYLVQFDDVGMLQFLHYVDFVVQRLF